MDFNLRSLQCYATYNHYRFVILPINPEVYRLGAEGKAEVPEALSGKLAGYGKIPNACPGEEGQDHYWKMPNAAMFSRHCLLAGYMQEFVEPAADIDAGGGAGGAVLLLDADVAARQLTPPLDEKWIRPYLEEKRADLVFFERSWGLDGRNEIVAGAYLARNTANARRFLVNWSLMANEVPPGFSSADNGALHLAIPRALGFFETDECEQEYDKLRTSVEVLDPYARFVGCARA
eukprot:g18935.t1